MLSFTGEIIDTDCDDKGQSTKYRLIGVVVHSGQASGGHYYSYINHRPESASPKWYKFDDGDVSECKMEDDEVNARSQQYLRAAYCLLYLACKT